MITRQTLRRDIAIKLLLVVKQIGIFGMMERPGWIGDDRE